jgi:DNA-directed RNA polymerase specialized sigma24 family protein
MNVIDELSYEEIAQSLNMTKKSVKTTMQKARIRLKKYLLDILNDKTIKGNEYRPAF